MQEIGLAEQRGERQSMPLRLLCRPRENMISRRLEIS